MERIKAAFRKFVAWVKARRWWIRLTGALTLIIFAQHVIVKGEQSNSARLVNELVEVSKDPDKYIEEEMQKLSNTMADTLENSLEGDSLSKEDVGYICWGLRNDWHNFIYD